jgi:hypothetical protein
MGLTHLLGGPLASALFSSIIYYSLVRFLTQYGGKCRCNLRTIDNMSVTTSRCKFDRDAKNYYLLGLL